MGWLNGVGPARSGSWIPVSYPTHKMLDPVPMLPTPAKLRCKPLVAFASASLGQTAHVAWVPAWMKWVLPVTDPDQPEQVPDPACRGPKEPSLLHSRSSTCTSQSTTALNTVLTLGPTLQAASAIVQPEQVLPAIQTQTSWSRHYRCWIR